MSLAVPDMPGFHTRLNQIISRLARNLAVAVDAEEEDADEIDDNLHEL